MLQVRRSKERGYAHHGWLESYHSFSFSEYYDPKFMGFGPLRVINEDWVDPQNGFGTHGYIFKYFKCSFCSRVVKTKKNKNLIKWLLINKVAVVQFAHR